MRLGHSLQQCHRVRQVRSKEATTERYSALRQDLWPELNRLFDATVEYRLSNHSRRTQEILSYRHRWVRKPIHAPTIVLLPHSAEEASNSLQPPAPACQYRAGLAQPRAPDFEWILPSALDASGYNPLARISAHHWATSGGQFPVQPERRRNRRTPNKDSIQARDAFHQHRDEGE